MNNLARSLPHSPTVARVVLAVIVAWPFCVKGQSKGRKKPIEPVPSATPANSTEPARNPAHVRIWKTELPGIASLRVVFHGTATGTKQAVVQEVAATGPGYQFADYEAVPAGKGVLEVNADPGERTLASLPADLEAGSYATLLVSTPEKNGALPKMELIPDRGGDEKTETMPTEFSVRNFAPGFHDMHVSVGDGLTAQFVAEGGCLRVSGLRPEKSEVKLTGKDADGNGFEWSSPGDFEQFRRQTLLIYPDPYGRTHPRLSVDGPPPQAPAVKPGEQS